ncbi:hypothetical protein BT96DRAFT_627137 [Gymnopus androsaceus JB14]|uniref:F-box domain-containing protein n=1 Tax=Gymnopus androsaceus JB14 TaxID=1447944 RepID=A0A6A4IK83_9AGAR|nr:hypothetical protein BT96DRAFT_627137 [Gymnopus androsaceus JB14]
MAALKLYLERSAQAPLFLDIFIDLPEDGYYFYHPPALVLLLQHTRRWKTVRYITDLRISVNPLSLPILEDLTVGSAYGTYADDTYHCFQAAPNLHALTIFEGNDSLKGLLSKLPSDQLTFLNTALPYWAMDDLRDLCSLTTLELYAAGHEGDRPQPSPISLAALKSLILTLHPHDVLTRIEHTEDFLHHLLPIFTFPSLNQLVIRRANDS